MVVCIAEDVVTMSDILHQVHFGAEGPNAFVPDMRYLRTVAARAIIAELRANDWNMTRTAERLGIERSHLYRKIKTYGITPPK